MSYLWSGMILLGIIYGAFTGSLQAVTDAAVSSSKEAVALCISMAGVTAMWMGVMKIAENAGLVELLSRRMRPVLRFLFPRLNPNSKVCKYISLNFISNMLGLGWAATPAGLKAMEELKKLEEERWRVSASKEDKRSHESHQKRKRRAQYGGALRGAASNEMCTFLIINVSSLQLLPVNLIAYRAQYGSVNPSFIAAPALLATLVSTGAAVIFCKVMDRKRRE